MTPTCRIKKQRLSSVLSGPYLTTLPWLFLWACGAPHGSPRQEQAQEQAPADASGDSAAGGGSRTAGGSESGGGSGTAGGSESVSSSGGSGGSGYACRADAGKQCEGPSPTFAEVAPIIAQCGACHTLPDYASVYSARKEMLAVEAKCRMLPNTYAEWELLRNWLACGASFDGGSGVELDAQAGASPDASALGDAPAHLEPSDNDDVEIESPSISDDDSVTDAGGITDAGGTTDAGGAQAPSP